MSCTGGPDPVERLAHRLLARYGSSPEHASRPDHNWANEVWLGETAVVRISRGATGSLARETALAAILPSDVGYPKVLGQDVTDGLEWMVTVRLPGESLETAWPTLDGSAQIAAVTDLWARLDACHGTDVTAARAIGCTATPFYELNETRARQLLDWLLHNDGLEPAVHGRLAALLDGMFQAITDVPAVLSHTDAGPNNTVWDGRNAVPIDFETASVAPADLDLEHVLRTLARHGEPNPAAALLEQAADLLARPGTGSRLRGYAVLRDLWGLRGWLLYARAGGDLAAWGADPDDRRTWEPWLNLQHHANGTSWLDDHLPPLPP